MTTNFPKDLKLVNQHMNFMKDFLESSKSLNNTSTGVQKVPQSCYEGQKPLIIGAIERTRRENILQNKILFHHPAFRKYGSDIFGGIYTIDGKRHLVMTNGYIYIKCDCNITIKYEHSRFVKECLKTKELNYSDLSDTDDDNDDDDDNRDSSDGDSSDGDSSDCTE